MNRKCSPQRFATRGRASFILIEAMLAVAIFALGMLTLGHCVTNCIAAEQFKVEDARARRALENRIAEIEAGARSVLELSKEKLSGSFAGLTLLQRSAPLKKRNEKNEELTGLVAVTLEVAWSSGGETRSRQLIFYVHPRPL
jgi:hypothetical protein